MSAQPVPTQAPPLPDPWIAESYLRLTNETTNQQDMYLVVLPPNAYPDTRIYKLRKIVGQGYSGEEHTVGVQVMRPTYQPKYFCTCPDQRARGQDRPCKHISGLRKAGMI